MSAYTCPAFARYMYMYMCITAHIYQTIPTVYFTRHTYSLHTCTKYEHGIAAQLFLTNVAAFFQLLPLRVRYMRAA